MSKRLCSYTYDSIDRAAEQTLPLNPPRLRFYQHARLSTELEQGKQRRFVYGEGPILAHCERSGESQDTALLGAFAHGTPTVLLTKAGLYPQAFSPYGVPGQPFSRVGFNAEQPDPVTGHYPLGNGYRCFNPPLMRFNSPDSWSPFGNGGLNAYAYGRGDPVNFADPSGHAPVANFVGKYLKTIFSKTIKKPGSFRTVKKDVVRWRKVDAPASLKMQSAQKLQGAQFNELRDDFPALYSSAREMAPVEKVYPFLTERLAKQPVSLSFMQRDEITALAAAEPFDVSDFARFHVASEGMRSDIFFHWISGVPMSSRLTPAANLTLPQQVTRQRMWLDIQTAQLRDADPRRTFPQHE